MRRDPPAATSRATPRAGASSAARVRGWRSVSSLFGARLFSRFVGNETKVLYSREARPGRDPRDLLPGLRGRSAAARPGLIPYQDGGRASPPPQPDARGRGGRAAARARPARSPRAEPRVGARDPGRHPRHRRRRCSTTATTVEIRPVISGGCDVKCRRCREPAVIEVRRHNAGFCADCFLHHCREQVRAGHRRLRDDRRPASGCSSPCRAARTRSPSGTSCSTSAYEADGLYLGLGIGDYSDESGDVRPRVRGERAAHAASRSTCPTDLGFDIPTGRARRAGACRARRAGCRSGTCSTRPPSTAATTWSPPATTSTTRPPCCSATCCAGRPTTWAASCPCCRRATASSAR